MSESQLAEHLVPGGELELDPFGLLPGVASKIVGLGGTATCHDPDYVLHTHYVEVAEGPAHFHVDFTGLKAKLGTLVLRVHMLPEPGAHSRLANSERIQLNRLVHEGGKTSIRFEGFAGVSYALFVNLPGKTDAEAEAVRVTLDRPADPHAQRRGTEARNTAFGKDVAKASAQLLSIAPPLLKYPVCQVATTAQLRERDIAELAREFGPEGSERARWEELYVFRALNQFGMLQPGARSLGLGVVDGHLAAAFAARGVSVLAAYPDDGDVEEGAVLDALRSRAAGEEARGLISVTAASLDPIAPDLANFDFLWSVGASRRLGSAAACSRFVLDAMACLRPGGIAVHLLDFDIAITEPDDGVLFRRSHAERLALQLISRSCEVAQIKIDMRGALLERNYRTANGPRAVTSFGLLCRKAPLSDDLG